MKREEAARLIRETFESPFDRDRYARFIRELLNHLGISVPPPLNFDRERHSRKSRVGGQGSGKRRKGDWVKGRTDN